MDAALRKTGITCIVVGLAFSPIAPIAGGLIESSAVRHAASLATTFGSALFVYGCTRIAVAKGQPWFYGLLGLLSCVGLGVLWFLVPDRRPT